MKRSRPDPVRRDQPSSPAESAVWLALQAALIAIALISSSGRDVYRVPKLLVLEGAAIVLFAACAIVSLLAPRRGILQRLIKHRWPVGIALGALLWTGITTLTSTQRTVSVETLLWVACCAALFLVSVALSEPRPLGIVAIALVPALINGVVAILQKLEIWNPFRFPPDLPERLKITGYLGNPNDLAGYLLLPCLAAMVMAVVHGGAARVLYGVCALVILGGMAATETVTALVALGPALFALILLLPQRKSMRIAAAGAMTLGLVILLQLPVAVRVRDKAADILAGRFSAATSGRTQGFFAAWAMFTDHPILGVGPGGFSYWYTPYNAELSGEHPEFLIASAKFGDVHNDHLQLLATTGLPGYALLLAALWRLGTYSFSGAEGNRRQRFAKLFAAPAALCVATFTLAAFPLELAAPASSILYFAALVVAWSRPS
jgi:O-antigen ligase